MKGLRKIIKEKVEYTYISKRYIRSQLVAGSTGVLHIGGHNGEELAFYDHHGKSVIWVEAIPELAAKLAQLTKTNSRHRVISALLGDRVEENVTFHVANNDFSSSSIFPFGKDLAYFSSELKTASRIQLPMTRLDKLLSNREVESHSHWVVDIQGAELMALRGAGDLIHRCLSLEIEVSTIEHYKGGVKFDELNNFLNSHGLICLNPVVGVFHGDVFYVRTGVGH